MKTFKNIIVMAAATLAMATGAGAQTTGDAYSAPVVEDPAFPIYSLLVIFGMMALMIVPVLKNAKRQHQN